MAARLTRWAIFSVAVSLIPLIFSFIYLTTVGPTPAFFDLISDGELLLISVALTGAAIGEVIDKKTARIKSRLASGGGCFLVASLSSSYFVVVSAQDDVRKEIVMGMSCALLLLGVISAGLAMAASEGEEGG